MAGATSPDDVSRRLVLRHSDQFICPVGGTQPSQRETLPLGGNASERRAGRDGRYSCACHLSRLAHRHLHSQSSPPVCLGPAPTLVFVRFGRLHLPCRSWPMDAAFGNTGCLLLLEVCCDFEAG